MSHEAQDRLGIKREMGQLEASARRVLELGGEELDQEARDAARDALARVKSHEALCTERWEQQRAAMARVEAQLAGMSTQMSSRIGWIPATIIAVLTSAVGWLAHL